MCGRDKRAVGVAGAPPRATPAWGPGEGGRAETSADYTRRDNVAERLVKKFGAAMGETAVKALNSHLPAVR